MTEIDKVFEDEAFAALYDDFNPWQACDDFYLNQALEAGGAILDLGCGTGMLACRIAAEGLSVVGVDPAAGMLKVARSRPGTDKVQWVKSDGQSLRLSQRFNLIYMTGHAFQVLLSDDDAVAVLKTAAHHLAPDGRFIFETRNPKTEAWQSWTPESSRTRALVRGHGQVEEFFQAAHDPQTGIVKIVHHQVFLDQATERVGHSGIRFISRDHLAVLIDQAGLTLDAWLGDWHGGPFLPDSREIIAVTSCK